MSAHPQDVLMAAQDSLLDRLLSGRVRTNNLRLELHLHILRLTRVGYKHHEAESCFWDAVHTAHATKEGSKAQAA